MSGYINRTTPAPPWVVRRSAEIGTPTPLPLTLLVSTRVCVYSRYRERYQVSDRGYLAQVNSGKRLSFSSRYLHGSGAWYPGSVKTLDSLVTQVIQ